VRRLYQRSIHYLVAGRLPRGELLKNVIAGPLHGEFARPVAPSLLPSLTHFFSFPSNSSWQGIAAPRRVLFERDASIAVRANTCRKGVSILHASITLDHPLPPAWRLASANGSRVPRVSIQGPAQFGRSSRIRGAASSQASQGFNYSAMFRANRIVSLSKSSGSSSSFGRVRAEMTIGRDHYPSVLPRGGLRVEGAKWRRRAGWKRSTRVRGAVGLLRGSLQATDDCGAVAVYRGLSPPVTTRENEQWRETSKRERERERERAMPDAA